jgi:hypothetical protein
MLLIPLPAQEAKENRTRVQSIRSSRFSSNPFFTRTHGPHFSGVQIQNHFLPPKFPRSSKRATPVHELTAKKEEIKESNVQDSYYNCSDDLISQLNKLAEYKDMIEKYKTRIKNFSPLFHLSGLTVALDLDETLMHVIPKQFILNHPCCIPLRNRFSNYCIIKRPFMDWFISTVKKFYNIVVL